MPLRDLSDHIEYVPGRGATAVAKERGLDPESVLVLSSNENALGPSPLAVEAITAAAPTIHRYPKASHLALTTKLARQWEVDPSQVWLANGGDGALDYLSRALLTPADTVLVPDPGFAYYGMSARFHHGDVTTYAVSRATDFRLDADSILAAYSDERIIYLTSPHNPSGSTMALEEIETIAADTPEETVIVVDEAYGEFSDTDSAISLVRSRSDVAILRSFSKVYGLAGIRLGYAIVPSAWDGAYSRVNTPFAVSEIACQAGIAALDDTDHLSQTVEMARHGRAFIRETVEANTWPSGGNFVLVDVGDAEEVTDALFDRGIIVRDCSSFGLESCIRITVAPEEHLTQAVTAINDILSSRSGDDPA